MNAKKIFVGAVAAMLINFSVASAEEVEIFGEEFEETLQPVQQEVSEPVAEPEAPSPPAEPMQEISELVQEVIQPVQEAVEKVQDVAEPVREAVQPVQETVEQVREVVQPVQPVQQESSDAADDAELGDELIFDDLSKDRTEPPAAEVQPPQIEITTPAVEITKPTVETPPQIEVQPTIEIQQPTTEQPTVTTRPQTSGAKNNSAEKQKKLKLQKQRFFKLTQDQNFVYYLDRDFVSWVRMPYSTTEYMADVWIRLLERNDEDLLDESEVDDIVLATEDGKQFRPTDVEVLRHSKYHLEHYYLRPKTRQIQYLTELSDIEGNPQNTVNERSYLYVNWENLVPSSIESKIYDGVIKIIGKGRASADAPVTFADSLEEYLRISIR